MKNIFLIITFLSFLISYSQKFYTKEGVVEFEASVPSFEEVRAKNKSATAIVDLENGDFAALVFINGFRFKNALMEEHFNENYAESKKYPKAKFKGKIKDFDKEHLSKTYTLEGELTFHGKTNYYKNIPISIMFKDDKYYMNGKLKTLPENYDIDIPNVVKNKIAEEILIFFEFVLKKK